MGHGLAGDQSLDPGKEDDRQRNIDWYGLDRRMLSW